MKHSKITAWKGKYLALGFFLPFGSMLFVMLVSGYMPFSSKLSMLYSDMFHQYYPFFVAFRNAIRSGDGLLYTWSVGLGMDYLGLISYYLASPLNLISVLVPDALVLHYFSLLMPVKLGLAGLFFALFLKHIFGREDASIAVFGGFYGLCAWALAYQWNVMWLDTFALLPLVALGTVWLIRDKKVILYTVTLFLSIFSNYYIGLFTCIFVALLFFCYEICRFSGWKRFFLDLGRIALFSALAIGMTAILELPALAALQTTQSSVNKFPQGFRLNIAKSNTLPGLLDAMRRVAGNMGGSLEPSFKEGLPNLYCGVGSLMFAILYLMAGDVKLRDKLCCVGLLVFFNISFIIRQLDYIWHGFHFTNMIPYRFSFLHCFVVLYMAYRAWTLRKRFKPLAIILAFGFTAALLCCSEDLLHREKLELFGMTLSIPVYIIYNSVFLLIYTAGMLYGQWKHHLPEDADEEEVRDCALLRRHRQEVARIWILGIIVVEMLATTVSFGLYFPPTNVTNYPKGTTYSASMIRYMKEREEDTLFYRAEMTHAQTLNDGALNGYNGISTFTSSANVQVTEFMRALGYGAKNTYNRYCFEESSPVANLFLGIRYMLDRDDKDRSGAYWTDIHSYGGVHLLKNNAYLPLGFLVEPELAMLDFTDQSGTFQFQNEIFSNATGMDRQVWREIDDAYVSIIGTGANITGIYGEGECTYADCQRNSYITYTFTVVEDGFMCIRLDLPKRNDYYVSINSIELFKETISLPQMIAVGDVKAGDLVQVRVMCDPDEKSSMTIVGAILDDALFFQGYEFLAASTWELTRFESTLVEGTIHCNRDGLLYTSIPQNGYWEIMVDGAPAETVLIGGTMTGVALTEGDHLVTMQYRNRAFILGWKVSALCLGLFAGVVMIYYPDLRKKLFAGKRK